MTDYGQGAEPPEPEQPSTPEPDDGPATPSTSDFSSGEGLVALAGILIVAVWLIFEVIAREYGVTTIAVVLGAAAAIIPRLDSDSVAKVMPVATAMKVLGYGLALVGLIEIVSDLRSASVVYDEALGLIGALLAYAAYAIALVGARQIKD